MEFIGLKIIINTMEYHMNNLTTISLVSALLLTMTSPMTNASTNGVYAGLGLGASKMEDFNDAALTDKTGMAGRVFLGYRFNDYLGLELDYAKFSNANYFLYDLPDINVNYRLSALSFLGKLHLPLNEQFNVYLGLGAAQMYSNIDASTNFSTVHYTDSSNATVFTASTGLEYKFTEHVVAQLDYTRYDDNKGDDSHLPVPASNLFTVGFTYLF